MIIAVDFDSTCVKNQYPEIGDIVPFCFEVLKKLQENGHEIILWTARDGKELQDAKNLCSSFIRLSDHKAKGNKETLKPYADIFIDDKAIGTPLIYGEEHPFVDWLEIDKLLFKQELYSELLPENRY